MDLFLRLDEYLKRHQLRLGELFQLADTDRSGALDRSELGRLLTARARCAASLCVAASRLRLLR